jgi:hypothetical protein
MLPGTQSKSNQQVHIIGGASLTITLDTLEYQYHLIAHVVFA